jgi:hypothetical protein
VNRSGHALQEAVEEMMRYSEQVDLAELHFQKDLSAIESAEQRILVAKRKLESSEGKKALFTDPNVKPALELHRPTPSPISSMLHPSSS